jgi:hypothetical protein
MQRPTLERCCRGAEPERAGVSPRAEAGADDRGPVDALRAGLAGSERIQPAHSAEAIHLRSAAADEVSSVSSPCLQLCANMLEWLYSIESLEDRMDPVLVREYRARWQAVSEIEAAEQQRTVVADRWARLNAILQMAIALGLDLRARNEDEAIVWQRWARLKAGSA